ncbi:MAG: class I SAM-dependent methyltransferase, partial [Candidatus Hydrogenedentes bacterium]|nr:class I SAM-dependent methyltransferase [Candidatus Hydrogenedentota bacterium]
MDSERVQDGIDPEWYEHAFGDLYPVVYAHRSVEAAAPEAAFAAEALGLRSGEWLLDLCCGSGRHLAHLSGITPRAVGLDYSRALLRLGRAQLGAAMRAVRGDMRAVPFVNAFDAVTS